MYTVQKEKADLILKEQIAELVDLEKMLKAEVHHYSDGRELIPAEVQAKMRFNDGQLPNVPQKPGYTVDDEGLVNAYALEPAMYFAEYPSPEQQRRYLFQAVLSTLLVALTVFIAFSFS